MLMGLMPPPQLTRGGFSIQVNGVRRKLFISLTSSSVMYFVLSYLTQTQIVQMCLLNKRFRDRFVPVTLGALTRNGTIPVNGFRQLTFAIQLEKSDNLLLMQVPWPLRLSEKRSDFWSSLKWQNETQVTKMKKHSISSNPFKFTYASWGATVTFERLELQDVGGVETKCKFIIKIDIEV